MDGRYQTYYLPCFAVDNYETIISLEDKSHPGYILSTCLQDSNCSLMITVHILRIKFKTKVKLLGVKLWYLDVAHHG